MQNKSRTLGSKAEERVSSGDAFILLRENAEYFFSFISMRDRESGRGTCVEESGQEW